MSAQLNRQPDGTFILTFTLTWSDISSQYDKLVTRAVSNTELPGFRKGKAPQTMVKPKLDPSALYSQVLQKLIPPLYQESLKTHNLKPLLSPGLKLKSSSPGQDWIVELSTCEAPPVTLPDYKSNLPKIKISDPKSKLSQILKYLLDNSQVNPPAPLIDELTNHKLTDLADNLTRLGLSSDQYLQSKKMTSEKLKQDLSRESLENLKLDFILSSIQDLEKLPDRQKTLDFLQSLV